MLNVCRKVVFPGLYLILTICLSFRSGQAFASEGGRNGPDLGGKSIAVNLDRGISARDASDAVGSCFFGRTRTGQRKSAMAIQIARALNRSYNVSLGETRYPMIWGTLSIIPPGEKAPVPQSVNALLFNNILQGNALLGDAIFERPDLSYAGQLAEGAFEITGPELNKQKQYVNLVNFYQRGNPNWSDFDHTMPGESRLVIKFTILSPNPDPKEASVTVEDVKVVTPHGFPTITYQKMVQTVLSYDDWGKAHKSDAQLFGLSIWIPDDYGRSVQMINEETGKPAPLALNMEKYVECLQGELQAHDR